MAKKNDLKVKNYKNLLDKVEEVNWNKTYLENNIIAWIKEKGAKNGDYLWPLRVSLSGLKNSPSPFEIAGALGKKESLIRIEKALQ